MLDDGPRDEYKKGDSIEDNAKTYYENTYGYLGDIPSDQESIYEKVFNKNVSDITVGKIGDRVD